MGEDREGHPVWYDNFNYDFKGKLVTCISPTMCYHTLCVRKKKQCDIHHPVMILLYAGLHYSVKMDDVLRLCMYRVELCMQRCAEASIEVHV